MNSLNESQKILSSIPNRKSPFYKTKVCPWYFKNRCTRSDECLFAHSIQELRGEPDLVKTSICPNIKNNGFCNDFNCSFAHKLNELRGTDDLYKTLMCVRYLKGRCNAGENCRYAHGENELRMKPIKDESTLQRSKNYNKIVEDSTDKISNINTSDSNELKSNIHHSISHDNLSQCIDSNESKSLIFKETSQSRKENYKTHFGNNQVHHFNGHKNHGKQKSGSHKVKHRNSNFMKDIDITDINLTKIRSINSEIIHLKELRKEILENCQKNYPSEVTFSSNFQENQINVPSVFTSSALSFKNFDPPLNSNTNLSQDFLSYNSYSRLQDEIAQNTNQIAMNNYIKSVDDNNNKTFTETGNNFSHLLSSSTIDSYPSFPDFSSLLDDDSSNLSVFNSLSTNTWKSDSPPSPNKASSLISRFPSYSSLHSYWQGINNNTSNLYEEQQVSIDDIIPLRSFNDIKCSTPKNANMLCPSNGTESYTNSIRDYYQIDYNNDSNFLIPNSNVAPSNGNCFSSANLDTNSSLYSYIF